jgi:hypothetical protein
MTSNGGEGERKGDVNSQRLIVLKSEVAVTGGMTL